MKTRHFAISQQGDSHVKSGKNCQDASGTRSILNENLKLEIAVAAIADGVGSCDYSEFGSKTAVETVLDVLGRELASLKELSDGSVVALLKKAFRQAFDNIEAEAGEKEIPLPLFDTTLTAAVLVEDGRCYVGHIGDDGIVALFVDGSYSLITERIEGEEANSVVPLSRGEENWRFGVAEKPVAALALMTDGLLDKSVGSAQMNNRVFYPFFSLMFEKNVMENDQDEKDLRSFWNDYLSNAQNRSQYGITDDITLAVVQIPEILEKVHPIPFDQKKWDDDTKKRQEEIEKGLNPAGSSQETTQEAQASAPAVSGGTQSPTSDSGKGDLDVGAPSGSAPTSGGKTRSMPGASDLGRQSPPGSENKDENPPCGGNPSAARPPVRSGKNHHPRHFPRLACGTRKGREILRFVLLSIFAVVLAFGIFLWARNAGYRKGLQDGVKQEQAAAAEKTAKLESEHQAELDRRGERGKQEGRDETLALPPQLPVDAARPVPQGMAPERFVISKGQKGMVVQTIQNMLITQGASLTADGNFGEKTALAVRYFQLQCHYLPPTGEVDILTYWALMKGVENNHHFMGVPTCM